MTNRTTNRALAATLVLLAAVSSALAQGPVRERLHYTINVPHALRVVDYILPPGKYTIHQVSATDPNLFALYQGDEMHTAIATLRTTRVDFKTGEYPKDTKLRLEIDESTDASNPVLKGWSIPGEDGWRIIAVDADDEKILVRVK